jgi:predicted PurR-regulated permease PerM
MSRVTDPEKVSAATDTAGTVADASWHQTRAILRLIFIVLTCVLVLWVLYQLASVILLVILAIFFAYLVAPLVELACRPLTVGGRLRSIPRTLAIGVVYLLIFGTLGSALAFLLPRLGTQITQFAQQAPLYVGFLRTQVERLTQLYERYQIPPAVRDTVNSAAVHTIETTGRSGTEGLGRVLLESIAYLPWLILIPILAFFLLKDAGRFRQSALRVLPRGIWRWRGDEFFDEVNSTLAAYIRAQLLACLLIGTVCTLGFSLIRLPYALLLGVVAGLLEFIPLVGPLVVAVLATLVASFYSAKQAMAVVAFLSILRIVHDYVVYPRLIGQGIHLHPLVVILAILAGAELGGMAGMFLAIPVVAVVSVCYRHGLQNRSTAGLVADWLKPAEAAMMVAVPSSSPAESSTGRSQPPSGGSSLSKNSRLEADAG